VAKKTQRQSFVIISIRSSYHFVSDLEKGTKMNKKNRASKYLRLRTSTCNSKQADKQASKRAVFLFICKHLSVRINISLMLDRCQWHCGCHKRSLTTEKTMNGRSTERTEKEGERQREKNEEDKKACHAKNRLYPNDDVLGSLPSVDWSPRQCFSYSVAVEFE
jgi:hypothetical protein